ncbi:MAG: LD-carboxypeptidase [Clostridia bacterium]|jgi:muramoyltetrapeptide carboxypeptidase|nr:LD-carboxypeptidase [Clostridia bacterium]
MRYPESLKLGDTIGICAPSKGCDDEEKIEKLSIAIKQFQNMGYKVIETASVRKDKQGRSASAKVRAKEFMELWNNKEVKLIIYAGGGDFLMEMLDELDFEVLKKSTPKWTQGFSDITHISFLLNTLCDIPSIYSENVKDYAMTPLYQNLTNSLQIAGGKELVQNSFEKYQEQIEDNQDGTYHLTAKVEWKNITGQEEIVMEGRALGGCIDCIDTLIGTKFDEVKEYIETYKQDGIIWFLEAYEMNTPLLQRILWKMKHAGYFKYCKGIVFGRPYIMREDYQISEKQAILDAIGNLEIPIIIGADIGHIPPQLAITQGAILKITSKDGKGTVTNRLK